MKKIAIIDLLLLFIISTLAFYTGFVVGSKKEEQHLHNLQWHENMNSLF